MLCLKIIVTAESTSVLCLAVKQRLKSLEFFLHSLGLGLLFFVLVLVLIYGRE